MARLPQSNSTHQDTATFFDSYFCKADPCAHGWSSPKAYSAFTTIIEQDTPAKTIYFIEDGLVKLSRTVESGKKVIAGLRRRNWIIGAPAVLLGKHYSFNITTLTNCRFRSISSNDFTRLLEKDPQFAKQMFVMLSREIHSYGKKCVSLGCISALGRLNELLSEVMREAAPSSGPLSKIKVPLKQREIAQMIAVTPEHLSRLLKQLESEGTIRREKGMIVLNEIQRLMEE